MIKRFSLCLFTVFLLSACTAETTETAVTQRQTDIATRGVAVMPFDLDKTMHIFEPLPNGGRQVVHVKDPKDTAQISLIQAHLEEEAVRFQNGDFADPAHIHGEMMPGLATLKAQADELQIVYTPLSDGGQIMYTSENEAVITVVHEWFTAQLSDHGIHAQQH